MASIWQQAEETALEELATVEAEIQGLQARLAKLEARHNHLRSLASTLAYLQTSEAWDLDDHPRLDVSKPPSGELPPTSQTARGLLPMQRLIRHTAEALRPLPIPPGRVRVPRENSTAYRAGLVLRDSGKVMTTSEVFKEFQDRGWVDPEWETPEATVAAALRRTVKWNWGTRLGSRHFVWPDAAPENFVPEHSGDDETDEGED